jgi:hypothetical protein
MKAIGVALILNSLGFTFWWLATQPTAKLWALSLCAFAVIAGFALIFNERVTEMTLGNVATLKTATEQAVIDAETIRKLTERVENQSATVDLVAKQAATAKALSEEVEKQIKQAAEKLRTLDLSTNDAQKLLGETRSVLEFTELVVAAQNDDRKSFDKLLQIAQDKANVFAERAAQAWRTIFEAHSQGMWNTGFKVDWKQGVDPTKLTLADLEAQYVRAPVNVKQALLEYVASRDDIATIVRLDFLMKILKTDPSLTAAEYAGRHFTRLAGLQIKPLAIDYLDKWWEEHRREFEGK